MWRLKSFKATAMAGGVIVTALLAMGMWLSIERLGGVAASQLAHVRAEEHEITLAERLRWSVELVVSTGRGYLITADPALLARLLRARAEFDAGVVALRGTPLTASDARLVAEMERYAAAFARAQEDLLSAAGNTANRTILVFRFERELLPLERKLAGALDELVSHKETALAAIYREADAERYRLATMMYGLLGILILLGGAITGFFAARIASAYRKEQSARELARRAVAARDELMGLVAHDLRNPLNAISMKAAVLSKLASSPVVEHQARSITSITLRMEHLIKSLLDVATIESGRFSVSPKKCDVNDLLRETVEIFATLYAAKHIWLLSVVDQAQLCVLADRERILQVFSNLLGNALKFAPRGSAVTIRVEAQSDTIQFSISDEGPGIAPAHLPHIFERFWKRDLLQTKGTGLGLFIVQGIVQAHHGQLWVDSKEGKGATFYFTLPAAVQQSDAEERRLDPNMRGAAIVVA